MADRVITYSILESWLNNKSLQPPVETIRDAVELLKEQSQIVHCKECKHAHLTYDGDCKFCEMDKDEYGAIEEHYRPGDWFCADAERK